MSRRNGAKVDLRLNLSQPRGNRGRVESSPNESPTNSCVSSEMQEEYSAAEMMLVGCPRCLMYVMLAEEDPRCPKCKSSVLLDINHDDNNSNNNASTATSRKSKKKS